ncbi:hypothetical protein BKA80DRAFT_1891 [Phyllosticta citrichinensis]
MSLFSHSLSFRHPRRHVDRLNDRGRRSGSLFAFICREQPRPRSQTLGVQQRINQDAPSGRFGVDRYVVVSITSIHFSRAVADGRMALFYHRQSTNRRINLLPARGQRAFEMRQTERPLLLFGASSLLPILLFPFSPSLLLRLAFCLFDFLLTLRYPLPPSPLAFPSFPPPHPHQTHTLRF